MGQLFYTVFGAVPTSLVLFITFKSRFLEEEKFTQYCRTAVVLHETEGRREARKLSQEAARSDGGSGAGLVNTDTENNLIGDGQGHVKERQVEGQGLNSNSEGRSGTGSQGSGTEALLAGRKKT